MGAQTDSTEAKAARAYDGYVEMAGHVEDHGDINLAPVHFQSHYAPPDAASQFQVRVEPFTTQFLTMNRYFDDPQRVFASIGDAARSASSGAGDVKELVPEMFAFPEVLVNYQRIPLGVRSEDGVVVDAVQLPSWATSQSILRNEESTQYAFLLLMRTIFLASASTTTTTTSSSSSDPAVTVKRKQSSASQQQAVVGRTASTTSPVSGSLLVTRSGGGGGSGGGGFFGRTHSEARGAMRASEDTAADTLLLGGGAGSPSTSSSSVRPIPSIITATNGNKPSVTPSSFVGLSASAEASLSTAFNLTRLSRPISEGVTLGHHTFTSTARAAMESYSVSENLHFWINLIFGFQQRGPAAAAALNVFHPACYEETQSADWFASSVLTDDVQRVAFYERVAKYGQTPMQLFPNQSHRPRTQAFVTTNIAAFLGRGGTSGGGASGPGGGSPDLNSLLGGGGGDQSHGVTSALQFVSPVTNLSIMLANHPASNVKLSKARPISRSARLHSLQEGILTKPPGIENTTMMMPRADAAFVLAVQICSEIFSAVRNSSNHTVASRNGEGGQLAFKKALQSVIARQHDNVDSRCEFISSVVAAATTSSSTTASNSVLPTTSSNPPSTNDVKPLFLQKDLSRSTERISAVSAARLACGDRFFVAPCPTLRHRQELRASESILLYPENLTEARVRYHAGASSGSAFGIPSQLFTGNTGCIIGGVSISSSGGSGGGGVGSGSGTSNGTVAALQLVINQMTIGSLTVGGGGTLGSSSSPTPTPTCAPVLTQYKSHVSASALEKIVASESTSSAPTNPSVLGIMTRLRQQHRYLNRCLRNAQLFLPLSGTSNYIDASGLRSANAGAYLLTSVTPIPMLGGGSVNVGGGGGGAGGNLGGAGGLGGGGGSSSTTVVGASALSLLQTLSNLRISSTYGSGSGTGCHDFNNRIIGAGGDAGPIGIAFPTGKPNNAALITTPHKDEGSGLFGGVTSSSNGAGSSGVDPILFGAQMYPYFVTKDVVEQYIEVKASGCEIALIDVSSSNATGRKVELCSVRVPHTSRAGLGNWSTLSAATGAAAGTNNQTITSIAVDYPLIYVGCSDGTISIITAWCPWSPQPYSSSDSSKYPHLFKHPSEHVIDPGAAMLRSHKSTVSVVSRGTLHTAVPRLSLCPYAVQRKRRELLAFERRSGVRSDGVVVEMAAPAGSSSVVGAVGSGGVGSAGGGGSSGGGATTLASGGAGNAPGGMPVSGTTQPSAAGRQTMAATMRRGALDYYDDEAEAYDDNGGGGLAFTNFGVLDDNDATDGSLARKRQAGIRSNGTGGGVGDVEITVGASGSQVLPVGQELTNSETMLPGNNNGVIEGSGCNPFAPADYYRHGSAAANQLMTSPNWEFTTVDVLNGGGHCGAVTHLSVSPEWGFLVSTSTNSTMTSQVIGPNALATASAFSSSSSFSSYQGFTANNLGIGIPGSSDFGSKESILRATGGTPHTEAAHIAVWDTKRRLLVRTLDLSPSSYSSADESDSKSPTMLFFPSRTAINPKGGSIVVFGSEYNITAPTTTDNSHPPHHSLHRQVLRVYSVNGDFMASTVIQGSPSEGIAGLVPSMTSSSISSTSSKKQKYGKSSPSLPSSVGEIKRTLRQMLDPQQQQHSCSSSASMVRGGVGQQQQQQHPLTWATLCLPPAMLGLACNTTGNTPGAIAFKHQCFGADPSPQHSTMYSENRKNPIPACTIAIALDSNDCVAHRTYSSRGSGGGEPKSRSRLSPSPSMSKAAASGGRSGDVEAKRVIVGIPQRLWSPSILLSASSSSSVVESSTTSRRYPTSVRVVYPCLPPTQSVTPLSASSSILLPTPSSGAQRSFLNYTRLVAIGPVILVIPDRSRRLLILDATTLECLKELKASYAHDAAGTLEFPPPTPTATTATSASSSPLSKTDGNSIVVQKKKSVDVVLSPSARLSATSTGMESITGLANTIVNSAAFSSSVPTTTKAGSASSPSTTKLLSTWQQPFTASNNELMGSSWQGELVSFAVNATGTAVSLVDRSGNVSTFKIQ